MQISAIDHVNIHTGDLDASIAFYRDVLGLTQGATPLATVGRRGAWMLDAAGQALIHLVARDAADRAAGPTGAIDHVALRCTGFAATRATLAAQGIAHTVNDGMFGLRQINLFDPDAVKIELNFPGD